MKKHSFIQKIILLIAIVDIGCSNSTQLIGDIDDTVQATGVNHVSLWETAYISDVEELITISNSMLRCGGFPFGYTSEPAGTISYNYTSNGSKREIVRLMPSTQSYISELYRIKYHHNFLYVTLITEDINDGYHCVVVPSDDSTTYVSGLFFFREGLGKLDNILVNDNYSAIRFCYNIYDSIGHIDSIEVPLYKKFDAMIFN